MRLLEVHNCYLKEKYTVMKKPSKIVDINLDKDKRKKNT